MAITVTQDLVDDFSQKIGFTGGRLGQYLDSYFDFVQDNYPFIINFFSGKTSTLEAIHFEILDDLIEESEQISQAIIERDYLLNVYLDWEMVSYLEDLKSELFTVVKTSKFLRSSKTNFNFTGSVEFNHVLNQNQTLEEVAKDVLLSPNPENDWLEIAQRNDLDELDYTAEGGNELALSVNLASRNVNVVGVIDNIIGERIHGLDIQKQIEFLDDDLKVLGFSDTIFQAVVILANLMKGDVPEFSDLGRKAFVGKSSSALGFSSLARDLVETFSSDDTLAKFTIENTFFKGTDFTLSFRVNTRLDEIIEQNVVV